MRQTQINIIPAQPETFAIQKTNNEKEPYLIFRVWAFRAVTTTKHYMEKDEDVRTNLEPVCGNFADGYETDDFDVIFVGSFHECDMLLKEMRTIL